ncbi:MAG: N-acetylglucosamine-6-phosphate deacetylase [Blastocatellia bacterium]|nr:MAG: N-acetylglucosamine-6-phosphate deacetylase [Blastocatellia bacterium]
MDAARPDRPGPVQTTRRAGRRSDDFASSGRAEDARSYRLGSGRAVIVLSGADLVLPDRIITSATLVIDADRIVEIRPGVVSGRASSGESTPPFAFSNHYIVPGYIDVHVHGVGGVDVLDASDAVGKVAGMLPQYGVTAFCPTTVACGPTALRTILDQVRQLREETAERCARVLPAHLESNFISDDYRGAQPAACLRSPQDAFDTSHAHHDDFTAGDILREIERAAPDVGIVTIAPELDGGLDLVRWLSTRGHRASLGHSGAGYELAQEAIAHGARLATHLFNRMTPFSHREPGLVGAILQTDEVAAELICDGFHVHPAVIRTAIAAKRPSRVLAITDATAAAGLPSGARATLGGQPIRAGDSAAYLDDGTVAGGVMTMDRVFRTLVTRVGMSLVDAVAVCSTTPARELGLVRHGVLAVEAVADLVILDATFSVVQTYVAGRLAYSRLPAA